MIEWYWCLLLAFILVVITVIVMTGISLFSSPDIDMDESEEFSGVIDVQRNIKDQYGEMP